MFFVTIYNKVSSILIRLFFTRCINCLVFIAGVKWCGQCTERLKMGMVIEETKWHQWTTRSAIWSPKIRIRWRFSVRFGENKCVFVFYHLLIVCYPLIWLWTDLLCEFGETKNFEMNKMLFEYVRIFLLIVIDMRWTSKQHESRAHMPTNSLEIQIASVEMVATATVTASEIASAAVLLPVEADLVLLIQTA